MDSKPAPADAGTRAPEADDARSAAPASPAAPTGPYTPPPLLGEELLRRLGPYEPPAGLGTGGHGRYTPPSGLRGLGNAAHATHVRSQVPAQVAQAGAPLRATGGPALAEPSKTAAAEPAEPASEAPTKPASSELTKPASSELTKPASSELTKPTSSELTKPAPAEPTKPAPAERSEQTHPPRTAPAPEPRAEAAPAARPEAAPRIYLAPADRWTHWLQANPGPAAIWAQWMQANPVQADQWTQWALDRPEEAMQWALAQLAGAMPGAQAEANLPAQAPQTASPAPASPAPAAPAEAADAPAPEPSLAATRGSYRGGLFDQLDVPAAASFLICAVLFVLTVVWVKSVDYSRLDRPTLEDVPERIARILMPLKPPGKAAPKAPGDRKPGPGKARDAAPGAGASASARIERSRRTVTEKVQETQERVKRVAMLSILSGKGPATQGAATAARARARGGGLVDFGGLEDQLANLEGLTKFDSKSTVNKAAETRDDGAGALAGIDKMLKGFQNAKVGTLAKVGVTELEKPELLERNSRYTGDRSMAEVGAFIGRKQAVIAMLYEERLKIDPTLEGKITVVLVIEEDGTVSSATVLRSETTLDDAGFQAELLRRIRRWIFPPSTGGPVEMKSPFVFKPA